MKSPDTKTPDAANIGRELPKQIGSTKVKNYDNRHKYL